MELTVREHVILTYLKDAVIGGHAVDLAALLNAPQYISYPAVDIIQTIHSLNSKELISMKPLFGKDPNIDFVVYDVTAKGRELV